MHQNSQLEPESLGEHSPSNTKKLLPKLVYHQFELDLDCSINEYLQIEQY
jgi:hypothetical protein